MSSSKAQKLNRFLKLVCDPEIKEEVQNWFDEMLINSGLKPVKRIRDLEKETGLYKFESFEEHEPTIKERLETLEAHPVESQPRPEENSPIPETTLDLKAVEVVRYLQEDVKPNDFGRFTLDRKGLQEFLTCIVKDDLRVKKVTRQLKIDLFERAVKLFPNIVEIRISDSGNKTKILSLKPSFKCIPTHTFTRTSPLGIFA